MPGPAAGAGSTTVGPSAGPDATTTGSNVSPEPTATADASDDPTTTGPAASPEPTATTDPSDDPTQTALPAGDPAGGNRSDGGGSGGPVEVSFWYTESDAREDALDTLVERFDGAHPAITVNTASRGDDRTDVATSWRQAGPADRPSLALMTDNDTRRLADSGQTVAPGDCLRQAVPNVVPSIAAAWTVDGVVRAVPFAVSTPVLVYDRSMFAEAGLDPADPPATLDDVRAAAQQLVDRGVVPAGLAFATGAASAGSWFVEHWNAQVGAPLVEDDDADEHDADASDGEVDEHDAGGEGEGDVAHEDADDGPPHAVWQDGPAVEHLAWLQAMVQDGLATSVGDGGCCDNLVEVFRREAAMTVHTSGALVEVLSRVPRAITNLGVAPLPGPGSGSLPGGAALWLSAGKPPAETAAAWALAAYLASPPAQAELAATTGYAPVTADATALEPLTDAWAVAPQLAVAYDVLAARPGTEEAQGLSVGPEEDIKQEVADAVDRIVAGEDPRAELRAVAELADTLLAAYWRQSGAGVSPPASTPR